MLARQRGDGNVHLAEVFKGVEGKGGRFVFVAGQGCGHGGSDVALFGSGIGVDVCERIPVPEDEAPGNVGGGGHGFELFRRRVFQRCWPGVHPVLSCSRFPGRQGFDVFDSEIFGGDDGVCIALMYFKVQIVVAGGDVEGEIEVQYQIRRSYKPDYPIYLRSAWQASHYPQKQPHSLLRQTSRSWAGL